MLRTHGIEASGGAVLDICCGSGIYTGFRHDRGTGDYTGVDLSLRAIEALTARYPGYRLVCADVTEATFASWDRAFDAVTLFDVLYHITDNARVTQALSNIAAVLNAPGKPLVLDQLTRADDYQLRPHVKFCTQDQFGGMLAAAKLRIVARYPFFDILSPTIRGPRTVDLPVCATYAAAGAVMRMVPWFGTLLGRTALAFNRLTLDRLKLRPTNGELFVIEKGGVT